MPFIQRIHIPDGEFPLLEVVQNFETLDVIPALTDEVREEIEAAIG